MRNQKKKNVGGLPERIHGKKIKQGLLARIQPRTAQEISGGTSSDILGEILVERITGGIPGRILPKISEGHFFFESLEKL